MAKANEYYNILKGKRTKSKLVQCSMDASSMQFRKDKGKYVRHQLYL